MTVRVNVEGKKQSPNRNGYFCGAMKKILVGLIFLLGSSPLLAQRTMTAVRTQEPILIDGKGNEGAWSNAGILDDFQQNFPQDSVPAMAKTVVHMLYDDENIYFYGICYENTPGPAIVSSLKRDFEWSQNENISFYIDTFNDLTNGFSFGVSAAGVQREGLMVNGSDVATDWDNKWFSAIQRYDDRWEFEMAIPFKTIRFDPEADNWNMSILRNNLKDNERTAWTIVPQGFRASSLAFAGKVYFDEPLKPAGTNISLIPYVAGRVTRDYDEEGSNSELAVGGDAKVAITSSLNLDLTFNPDFSQVEVDQQQTNLSRFELFFPERRQFFLENQDLFGESGFRNSRPFFSRRIGIASDTAGNAKQIPIIYGARVSGKVGRDWRVGLLNMQTRAEDDARLTGTDTPDGSYQLLAQNYTVGVIQRRVFSRSNIGAIVVNRQAVGTGNLDSDSSSTTTPYNRVVGIDYNLLSADGRWEGDFFVHHSFDEDQQDDAFSAGAFLRYRKTKWDVLLFSELVGAGYNAEVGFIRRKNIFRVSNRFNYRFYPGENSRVNNHGPTVAYSYITDTDFNTTDYNYTAGYQVQFTSSASARFEMQRRYELLRRDFNPTGSDSTSLVEGSDYSWSVYTLNLSTDQRKLFSAQLRTQFGGFYSGKRLNIRTDLNYRIQPYVNLSMRADYNRLQMPEGDLDIWLVGPRIELTFTDKLFLTTFIQYNDQQDNVNLNLRLQWRYKPVSDFFIVYTDNYFPEQLQVKDRAVVAKFTYWLNM